jgi:hypothetical protein
LKHKHIYIYIYTHKPTNRTLYYKEMRHEEDGLQRISERKAEFLKMCEEAVTDGKCKIIQQLVDYKSLYAKMWSMEFIQGSIRTHLQGKYGIKVRISKAMLSLHDLQRILICARVAEDKKSIPVCKHNKSIPVFTADMAYKMKSYHRSIDAKNILLNVDKPYIHLGAAFESLWAVYPTVALDLLTWWQPGVPSGSMKPKLRRRRLFTWVMTHAMEENIMPAVRKQLEHAHGQRGWHLLFEHCLAKMMSPSHATWRDQLWDDCVERGYLSAMKAFALLPDNSDHGSLATPPKREKDQALTPASTVECCICLSEDLALIPFSGVGTTDDGKAYTCSHQVCCAVCSKGLHYCPLCRALLR